MPIHILWIYTSKTSMASKKFEDMDLSSDEIKRLETCLKDKEFRKLFVEYAEEISNPENKKRYEEEIRMMEEERGMNVEFIHPKPGHVLKTSVNDTTKAFINICQSEKMAKPSSTPQVSPNGKRGINWSIPHSHMRPREELDKQGNKCTVFDVAFHPDTYRMTENERFRQLVENTAIDGIENQLGCKVDKKNIKRMKNLKYKGTPVASVIRTKKQGQVAKENDADDILNGMPYPYNKDCDSSEKAREMRESVKKSKENENKKNKKISTGGTKSEQEYPEPKYTLIHRSELDLQEYTNAPDACTSTRPKELEIKIFLPLLDSAKQVDVDIFEQKLTLKSEKPAKYKLDMKLAYPVDEDEAKAKFDKSKKCLVVTVPVLPSETAKLNGNIHEKELEDDEKFEKPLCLTGEKQNGSPLIQEMSNGSPLIQEIHSNVETQQEDVPSEDEGLTFELPIPEKTAPQVLHSFPEFNFNQDQETVSFIINVKRVAIENISKTFPSKNQLDLTFVSIGSGGFPLHYRFLVKFPESCRFAPDHCSIDTSEENIVVLLLKERDSRGIWNGFLAGCSEEHLKEYLFVTETNLQRELEELEAEAALHRQEQVVMPPDTPTVQVTDMNQHKLTIDIKKYSSGEEEEIDDCPSSADIEVVHEKLVPDLHGILKQRSVSESSDDFSSSCNGSISPGSPREDLFGHRKSVSFSEKIDKATFKSNAAVSTMTSTLKNKRRRMRKQEKRNGRKRCNSGGSSSGEDMEHRNSGDSQSEHEVSPELEDKVIFEETKECKQENGDAKKAIVQNIKDKIALGEGQMCDDSDDDCDDDDKDNMRTSDDKETKADDVKSERDDENHERTNKAEKVCESVNEAEESDEAGEKVFKQDSGNADVQVNATNVISKQGFQEYLNDPDTSVIKVKADASGDDSGVECSIDEKASPTDTMLSWKDKGDGVEDLGAMDHSTQCAFNFSNAVIYDLDVD